MLELVLCERCGSLRASGSPCDVCALVERARAAESIEDPTAGHDNAQPTLEGSDSVPTIQDASPLDLSSRIALARSSSTVDVGALSVMEREFLEAIVDDARLEAIAARLAVSPQGAAKLAASLLERGVIVTHVLPRE